MARPVLPVRNDVELDESSVWVLKSPKTFSYSDGLSAEIYLGKVLSTTKDLSSDSKELGTRIRDWPSEYHLSSVRSQLLRPFVFKQGIRVLEVGAGAGAITRFLGEEVSDVVGVEGSLRRARLARLRTKDLQNVEIICAPFHELQFKTPFDLVVCVGVLEYASQFIAAEDPYDRMLEILKSNLAPSGALLLAIENQFGLKYFAGAPEDHAGRPYEGLEGYTKTGNRFRTFGRRELQGRLQKLFRHIDFFFPYPDYKLPSCIVSERMHDLVDAGELVSAFLRRPRDQTVVTFSERRVSLDLARNKQLPDFANSFVVVASSSLEAPVKFPHLGVAYSQGRRHSLQTVTEFHESGSGEVRVRKRLASGAKEVEAGKLRLRSTDDNWINGWSIHTQLIWRAGREAISLDEFLEPIRPWLEELRRRASVDTTIGRVQLPGEFIDAVWRNAFVEGDGCAFVDQEWVWKDPVALNVIFIRAAIQLFEDIDTRTAGPLQFWSMNRRRAVVRMASHFDLSLTDEDFADFVAIEQAISTEVFGLHPRRAVVQANLRLMAPWFRKIASGWTLLLRRVVQRLGSVAGRLGEP